MIHVIPVNDLDIHHESELCPCNPVENDGVIVHNAYDGRGFDEAINESPKTNTAA